MTAPETVASTQESNAVSVGSLALFADFSTPKEGRIYDTAPEKARQPHQGVRPSSVCVWCAGDGWDSPFKQFSSGRKCRKCGGSGSANDKLRHGGENQ